MPRQTKKSIFLSSLLSMHTSSKSAKVLEVGRDICENAGGVESMSLFDYSEILSAHSENIREAKKKGFPLVLVDTDALYTKHYLSMDERLKAAEGADAVAAASVEAAKKLNPSLVLFLNIDVPFVQDGTRIYESSREEDNERLLSGYKLIYGDRVVVVSGADYKERQQFCVSKIEALIG